MSQSAISTAAMAVMVTGPRRPKAPQDRSCPISSGLKGSPPMMQGVKRSCRRKITDEFEGNDSPDACTGTAETADRCHGFAVVKVGWQHVRHGRETCIAKGC